jgi:hypothetical protein
MSDNSIWFCLIMVLPLEVHTLQFPHGWSEDTAPRNGILDLRKFLAVHCIYVMSIILMVQDLFLPLSFYNLHGLECTMLLIQPPIKWTCFCPGCVDNIWN